MTSATVRMGRLGVLEHLLLLLGFSEPILEVVLLGRDILLAVLLKSVSNRAYKKV
jgi:hypothetical protein